MVNLYGEVYAANLDVGCYKYMSSVIQYGYGLYLLRVFYLGQSVDEFKAALRIVAHLDAAAMSVDGVLDNGQSETGSACLA